jgi:hypothetical protein
MRVLRTTTVLAGAAILGYGAYGLLTAPEIADRQNVGEWLIGGVLLHDLVLAPFVFGLGWLATRFTGTKLRAGLAAALLITGTLVFVAAPLVLHGRVAIR